MLGRCAKYFFIFTMLFDIARADTFHFASIEGLVEQEIGRLVLPAIYQRLGITITITPLPGKRAELEATTGISDGEIMRIYSYGEENPTVHRVPTPYYYLHTMAFTKAGSEVFISDREDLKKYSVVKVRGVKHTNNITQGLENVTDVSSTVEVMRLVEQGLADVGLTNTIDGLVTIAKMGLQNIATLETPLATLELFHYIHEDHKGLVPVIDQKIRSLRDSGELFIMIEAAEKQIFETYNLEIK